MSSLNRESVDTYKGSLAQAPILPIAAPRLPALGAPRFHASAPKPASTLPAAGPKRRGPQKDQSARKTEDVDGKKRYKESYQQLRNAQRRAKRAQERIEKLKSTKSELEKRVKELMRAKGKPDGNIGLEGSKPTKQAKKTKAAHDSSVPHSESSNNPPKKARRAKKAKATDDDDDLLVQFTTADEQSVEMAAEMIGSLAKGGVPSKRR
jgi:hypothetical protein